MAQAGCYPHLEIGVNGGSCQVTIEVVTHFAVVPPFALGLAAGELEPVYDIPLSLYPIMGLSAGMTGNDQDAAREASVQALLNTMPHSDLQKEGSVGSTRVSTSDTTNSDIKVIRGHFKTLSYSTDYIGQHGLKNGLIKSQADPSGMTFWNQPPRSGSDPSAERVIQASNRAMESGSDAFWSIMEAGISSAKCIAAIANAAEKVSTFVEVAGEAMVLLAPLLV